MAGVWSVGSSLDVESIATLCGHCFCQPAAGDNFQQEVCFCFFILTVLFFIFASVAELWFSGGSMLAVLGQLWTARRPVESIC